MRHKREERSDAARETGNGAGWELGEEPGHGREAPESGEPVRDQWGK